MDKKSKSSYKPPKVTSVAFRVENAMESITTTALSMPPLSTFGDGGSWDDQSSSSSTNLFGNGDWGSGSSSSNTTFGSGSWD